MDRNLYCFHNFIEITENTTSLKDLSSTSSEKKTYISLLNTVRSSVVGEGGSVERMGGKGRKQKGFGDKCLWNWRRSSYFMLWKEREEGKEEIWETWKIFRKSYKWSWHLNMKFLPHWSMYTALR